MNTEFYKDEIAILRRMSWINQDAIGIRTLSSFDRNKYVIPVQIIMQNHASNRRLKIQILEKLFALNKSDIRKKVYGSPVKPFETTNDLPAGFSVALREWYYDKKNNPIPLSFATIEWVKSLCLM